MLEDLAALGGDSFRGVEIRKVALGKAKITVKGIEQDLEGSLERVQRAAFERIVDQPKGVLRLNPNARRSRDVPPKTPRASFFGK